MERIAVLGLGLIGGSLALALHQADVAERVVGAHDAVGTGNVRAVAEGPDHLVGFGIDFDDAIVELIGDEKVSIRVRLRLRDCSGPGD